MGANFNERIFRTSSRDEAGKAWDAAVRESEIEDGMSYSGCIGMLRGEATWEDLKLGDEDVAREYLQERHRKWSPARAVSFRASDPEAVRAREARSQELYQAAYNLAARHAKADRTASGDFPECRACRSKISRKHLRNSGHCPACNDPMGFLTEAHAREVEALQAEAASARDAPIAAGGGGTWWMVGGWCAS